MHVSDYIDKFEDYRMCCNVREDPLVTFSRFKVGLPELRSKLTEHGVHTLEQTYQVAQYSERYLTPQIFRHDNFRGSNFQQGASVTKSNLWSQQSNGYLNIPSIARSNKGQRVISSKSNLRDQWQCYKCQGFAGPIVLKNDADGGLMRGGKKKR